MANHLFSDYSVGASVDRSFAYISIELVARFLYLTDANVRFFQICLNNMFRQIYAIQAFLFCLASANQDDPME